MKTLTFLLCLLCLLAQTATAQLQPVRLPDGKFPTYYHQRASHFRTLPHTRGDVIFLGNSISDSAEWSELFDDPQVKNRGISGDVSAGVLNRVGEVVARRPAKVFVLIGTNDLAGKVPPDSVVKNITWLADYLRQESPATRLYVQSILPVNDAFGKFAGHVHNGALINQVNEQLRRLATAHGYTYLDLHAGFADATGKLDARYTNDGLHLTGAGYMRWKHLIYPKVYDLQDQLALLPLPQQVQWTAAAFPLYQCRTIVVQQPALLPEAERLKQLLAEKGLLLRVTSQPAPGEAHMALALGPVAADHFPEEAYALAVTDARVQLTANTAHGIFNGLQTLVQLCRDGAFLPGCTIRDWPAFGWRGYMVDVGRNYQPMSLLKQQIDAMARYKLNVFHFHATEDIAWRLQVPGFAQLTAPEHMLRDPGQYYSEAEVQELIGYCRARYITLVPELDMPGHSAAFTRATGTVMQSPAGLTTVKEVLTRFTQTYDVPYLHVGADEVKITNSDFLPQVTGLLHQMGKKTIGWEPGGNLDPATIRQLWMREVERQPGRQYIDSRHLYLNHMDPLESVVTVFNRRLGDAAAADSSLLGATLCVWNDRRVARPEEVLQHNAVYPALLAFAERSWCGGGYPGWVSTVGQPDSERANAFKAFERRLLDHKALYFRRLPFPYAAQADISWQLLGPYPNKGDLTRAFAPEKPGSKVGKPAAEVAGGTVVLRHWWSPQVAGALEQPRENTTWYATTRFWSNADTTGYFWIGFNDLSRSYNSASPAAGTWDNRGSAVLLNGQAIAPPAWQHPGQPGHPEVPLQDEGYSYRPPTAAPVRKGWNTVLVKLPVGRFKGSDWQNPVKWMFTFVPLGAGG
ncbi:family 20 glycosylhydrolase (plasmid) [Hymenobacter sp. NBH84]|uniref:family 20 glycosylhydrolase n=1 Tax=Hymenobacter sp. NBH84 TaxID=2596915 RepID=UPI0016256818|nr:family 20 glycosylhydrolase [Hymenobacter sp. NBH84]QNE41948.1 family 20 glycosylhydrolase [Hymenobacter sp. NBH84]